jgi:hypothetical protein
MVQWELEDASDDSNCLLLFLWSLMYNEEEVGRLQVGDVGAL